MEWKLESQTQAGEVKRPGVQEEDRQRQGGGDAGINKGSMETWRDKIVMAQVTCDRAE